VSYLPPSTIHKLAAPSTPEQVRAEIIGKIEAGEKLDAVAIDDQVQRAQALAYLASVSPSILARGLTSYGGVGQSGLAEQPTSYLVSAVPHVRRAAATAASKAKLAASKRAELSPEDQARFDEKKAAAERRAAAKAAREAAERARQAAEKEAAAQELHDIFAAKFSPAEVLHLAGLFERCSRVAMSGPDGPLLALNSSARTP
jgi:signal transduction histidine kinase